MALHGNSWPVALLPSPSSTSLPQHPRRAMTLLPTIPLQSKALVLCAGRGMRMRPLSDQTPKPLLAVHGKPLVVWHLERLARDGINQVLLNTAWLGGQIVDHFKAHPQDAPVRLAYSREDLDFGGALETAGGVVRALPQLADPFWVMAADVYSPGFVFAPKRLAAFAASPELAHVWLVPNPSHHPKGDFCISAEGLAFCPEDLRLDPALANPCAVQTYTFSTMALYKKAFFNGPWCKIESGNTQGLHAPLAPMLKAAMKLGLVGATLFKGFWCDVGTPERLSELNATVPHEGSDPPQTP